MSIFGFLFGSKEEREETQTLAEYDSHRASGTQLSYRPNLISQLKEEHRRLLVTFGWVKTAFANKDLASVDKHLSTLRREVLAHLVSENLHLYVYLERGLKQKNQAGFELLHKFRPEMDTIGSTVQTLLTKYQNISTQPHLVASFGKDLEIIESILVERIQLEEETLYPLYQPI